MPDLSPLEIRMLKAGEFHVDGWTSPRGYAALVRLEELGFVSTFESGGDQYTAINATITDAGRAWLRENLK